MEDPMRQCLAVVLCLLLPLSAFPQAQTSAVKNSFQEVTSHLNPGGNLYLYLSTEEWLRGLSDQIGQIRDLINAVPSSSAADKQNTALIFGILSSLIKQSGVEDVSGFGMSSIAVEKGLYQTEAMLHHYRGNNRGFLWSMFGKQPHAMDVIDLLPANTVFAAFTDLDLSLLWSVVTKEVEQSGVIGGRQSVQGFRSQFASIMGADLEQSLASLAGECGIAVTLDEPSRTGAAMRKSSVSIPQVGLMLVCKVKNDSIFNAIEASWRGNPSVIRINRADLRMRTITSPSPVPINLRPSIARSGDYLFVASSDALVQASVGLKAGTGAGLKSSDEFKRLSQRLPQQGNGFTFRSQKIAEMIGQMQSLALAAAPGATDITRTGMLTSFFGSPGAPGTYSVTANTDEGFLFSGNSGQNPATTLLMFPTMAVTLIVATIAIPSLLRSRQAANESSAVASLRTIAAAEAAYSSTTRGNYAGLETLVAQGLLDSRFGSGIAGYEFSIAVSGRTFGATAIPAAPDSGRYGYFVTTDGIVRYSTAPGLAPPALAGQPVQ
jgi:hypothetical protein